MSKLKKFNLEDYNKGTHIVETYGGANVEIVAIDEKRNTIFGFYDKDDTPTNWNIDGSYFRADSLDHRDLYLRPKSRKLHINITRNKYGSISCSSNVDRQPKLYTGTVLVKYLTVEIDE